MALTAGERLGPYEIQSPLGAGGMGEVYRARDTRLDRQVAIKILPTHFSANSEAKERFDREARAISSLSHPNICQLYDVGMLDGISFLVMEYLEGETLADRVGRGALGLDEILRFSLETADALEIAHRKRLIHRDLKPANIFLTQEGHAKLLDFGLAKGCHASLDAKASEDGLTLTEVELTSPGSTVGTIAYMSPEQARGESLDRCSDLFSLGVVIYEMATGRRPFAGRTTAMIFNAILNQQPVAVTELNPSLPASFRDVLNRLLAKMPRDRYQSARELIEALQEIQRAQQLESSGKMQAGRKIPSIAVLPFANLSADPDNQYFSDGLSEDLTSALARLHGLQVASRTSAFRFRGAVDIREVGRQLNVEAVLEGSVRRSGKRLRITAELVNVADGYHLWSERYDREITDVFEIQDEIAGAIVKTLEPTLAGQQQALSRRHSVNVQAYELYLKGRRLWEQRTESALRAGLECFRAAIDLDPGYALAHAGIGDSYCILAGYGHISFSEGKPRAEAAVKKALERDSTLAEAHFSAALVATYFGDRERAQHHFRNALEIQPRSSVIHAYYGLHLAFGSRFAEADASMQLSLDLDPLSPFVQGVAALNLVFCGKYEEAINRADKGLELQPNFVLALWPRLLAAGYLSRWEESFAAGQNLAFVSRRSSQFLGELAMVHAMAGEREKALTFRQELVERQRLGEYINPGAFLAADVGLGDMDSAYADLLGYVEDGGKGFVVRAWLGRANFDKLAAHPSCAELLRKSGLLG